jgi:hypothetical protein
MRFTQSASYDFYIITVNHYCNTKIKREKFVKKNKNKKGEKANSNVNNDPM